MTQITVFPHYERLYPTASKTYRDQVQTLLDDVFRDEPWYDWIKACFRHPCLGIQDTDSVAITHALDRLCRQRADHIAHSTLTNLTQLIPPETDYLECHLYPSHATDRGGGMSFAPSKMLVAVPISSNWTTSVQRNCAHEYSHTVRMALWPQDERHGCGPAVAYNIRHYLVFEGLAEALADEVSPAASTSMPLEPAAEEAYWQTVAPHLEETGWPAYIAYLLGGATEPLPADTGGKIGQRIVQSYMTRHGKRASALQKLAYEEIYWNSGYAYVQ